MVETRDEMQQLINMIMHNLKNGILILESSYILFTYDSKDLEK